MNAGKFEKILEQAISIINAIEKLSDYNASKFEALVADTLKKMLISEGADGSKFKYKEGSTAFPDIAFDKFGVEIKTTKSDSWICLGNSIMEGTRTVGVESIYVVFLKRGGTPKVKFLPYEKVINDIKITHSPRYEINMESAGDFFDNLNISYEEFRNSNNKICILSKHYRNNDITSWFLDSVDGETTTPITLTSFSELDKKTKSDIWVELICLFPEVIKGKYDQAAAHMITKHGCYNSSLRDMFSSGGKYTCPKNKCIYPAIVGKIMKNIELIKEFLKNNDKLLYNEFGFSEDYVGFWIKIASSYLVVDISNPKSIKNYNLYSAFK